MFGACQVAGMSVGEAQLTSLARVLMRKDEVAVVVIDEASLSFVCKPSLFRNHFSHLQPCIAPACMQHFSLFLSCDDIMRSKELKTSRFVLVLILSIILVFESEHLCLTYA